MSGDYDQASPDQKLNIATYFVMSSPTGEVDEVMADVKKLVSDTKVLSNEATNKILCDYNCEQMTSASDPDGVQLLVSSHGKVTQDTFLDPNTGRVLRFDHQKRKFLETVDSKKKIDAGVEKYRAALLAEIQSYVENNYGRTKAVGTVYGTDSGNLTVCVSAKNVNLGNFWTGGWRSQYTLNVKSGSPTDLKGNIKTNVHYFEDGNVQLHTNIDKNAQIDVKDETQVAKDVVAAINKIESDFQSHLEEMYVNMHKTTFKAMRRFLPISRKPMTWSAAAHNLAAEVSKTE